MAILPNEPLTGYEPNEQFENLTAHTVASIQGDSGNGLNFSLRSMTEVAATTLPGTESFDHLEMGCDNESMDTESLQEEDGARKKTKSPGVSDDITRKRTTKLFSSINGEIVQGNLPVEASVPASQSSTQLHAEFRAME